MKRIITIIIFTICITRSYSGYTETFNHSVDLMKNPYSQLSMVSINRGVSNPLFDDIMITDESKYLYVSSVWGEEGNSGTKYQPLSNFQTAIEMLKGDNYEGIRVHGDYQGSLYLFGVTNVIISGGWNSNFTKLTNKSILSGKLDTYHVLFLESCKRVEITGFTITGGNANGEEQPNNCGGGIYATKIKFCYFDCVISNNTANKFGGGIFFNLAHLNSISDSINNNTAVVGGGIFASYSVKNYISATIIGNSADLSGGGAYLVGSTENTFWGTISNNSTLDYNGKGAGIYLAASQFNTLMGSISDNNAIGNMSEGGGIYLDNSKKNTITATIHGNTAANGGGIYSTLSFKNDYSNASFLNNTPDDVQIDN